MPNPISESISFKKVLVYAMKTSLFDSIGEICSKDCPPKLFFYGAKALLLS